MQNFPPCSGLSFHSPDSVLWCTKVFNFHKVLTFLFFPVILVSCPRNHCQIQCYKAFPLISSKIFKVLVSMVRFLFHFELIFICGERVQFHSLACEYPVFLAPSVEKDVLFPSNDLGILGAICVLTRPLNNSNAHSHLRTTLLCILPFILYLTNLRLGQS